MTDCVSSACAGQNYPQKPLRLLVFSDTHGDSLSFKLAMRLHPEAEVVFHLGDGAPELDALRAEYPDKMLLCVKGNCDWGSALPESGVITLRGQTIFYTHGHNYGVKHDFTALSLAAAEKQSTLVLFGHTHQAYSEYVNGVTYFNPGAMHGYRPTYGIIDLTANGIITNAATLK